MKETHSADSRILWNQGLGLNAAVLKFNCPELLQQYQIAHQTANIAEPDFPKVKQGTDNSGDIKWTVQYAGRGVFR